MGIVLGQIIRHARQPRVHIAAAQRLGRHHLARRCFDQWRPSEEDRPLLFHDDRHIRHRRHIGSACRATAHDDSDLGNTLGAHLRLIVENTAKVIAVGEDLILIGQVRAAAIDQIDAGQMVGLGDLLGAQMLFDTDREVSAAFDRRIIAQHHDIAALNPAHACDHPTGRTGAVIHPVPCKHPHFQKG